MDKNLDTTTFAVSLVIKAAIIAAQFSGKARKRSLKCQRLQIHYSGPIHELFKERQRSIQGSYTGLILP